MAFPIPVYPKTPVQLFQTAPNTLITKGTVKFSPSNAIKVGVYVGRVIVCVVPICVPATVLSGNSVAFVHPWMVQRELKYGFLYHRLSVQIDLVCVELRSKLH